MATTDKFHEFTTEITGFAKFTQIIQNLVQDDVIQA